ncbi:MAG: ATPase, T2SS/T4P/T4SS family [Nanopusillaceae archaeon]
MLDLNALLQGARKARVSDILFSVGVPPAYKLGDEYVPVGNRPVSMRDMEELLGLLHPEWPGILRDTLAGVRPAQDHVASFAGVVARFRAHLSWALPDPFAAVVEADRQDLVPVVNLRVIPGVPETFDALGLPQALETVVQRRFGLFLVAGPSDSGKTTTLAAMIEAINRSQPRHVVTIENPVEYVYERKQALIHQREVGRHVPSLLDGVYSALRQNVSVLAVGEARTSEELLALVEAAETGHLVMATMHGKGVVHVLERFYWAAPGERRASAFQALASLLIGIIAQRLVPVGAGLERRRVLAYELLLVNERVRQLLRGEQIGSVYELLHEGIAGSRSLEASLAALVRKGVIDLPVARAYANREEELVSLLRV